MDYTNDYGTYIREYSHAESEEEWLLSFGTKLEINEIYPAYMKKDTELIQKIEKNEIFSEDDIESLK